MCSRLSIIKTNFYYRKKSFIQESCVGFHHDVSCKMDKLNFFFLFYHHPKEFVSLIVYLWWNNCAQWLVCLTIEIFHLPPWHKFENKETFLLISITNWMSHWKLSLTMSLMAIILNSAEELNKKKHMKTHRKDRIERDP